MSQDDDMPEMAPSKADARRTLSHARARALQHLQQRTVWDGVDEEMLEVLVDLKMLREMGSEADRKFALRELAQLWCRMPPRPDAGLNGHPNETDEQRSQRLRALFKQAPPVLRKALLEWKKEEEARS